MTPKNMESPRLKGRGRIEALLLVAVPIQVVLAFPRLKGRGRIEASDGAGPKNYASLRFPRLKGRGRIEAEPQKWWNLICR